MQGLSIFVRNQNIDTRVGTSILVVAILILVIPLTVILSQQNQDIRQNAAGSPSHINPSLQGVMSSSLNGQNDNVVWSPGAVQFSAYVSDTSSLTRGEIWVATSDQKIPFPYSCPGRITGPWCNIAKTSLIGTSGTVAGSYTFINPGNYSVVVNGYDSNGAKCSGNPFSLPSGWTSCGSKSRINVTIATSHLAQNLLNSSMRQVFLSSLGTARQVSQFITITQPGNYMITGTITPQFTNSNGSVLISLSVDSNGNRVGSNAVTYNKTQTRTDGTFPMWIYATKNISVVYQAFNATVAFSNMAVVNNGDCKLGPNCL